MVDKLIIQIPFAGFYESKWSGEIDHVEENETEYFETERQAEDGIPEELRLTAAEYLDILFWHTSYSQAYDAIARQYVPEFNAWLKDETDLDLGLTFESMSSPREYNFTTDRIFAEIPVASVRAMFERSAVDGHARLVAEIKRRHTSRSGFASYYRPNMSEWPSDVAEWDHNQLETLLFAVMPVVKYDSDDYEWRIYDGMADGETFYSAWSDAVDWPEVEKAIGELRAEKAEEWAIEHPTEKLPYRCSETPDLFADKSQ